MGSWPITPLVVVAPDLDGDGDVPVAAVAAAVPGIG